MQLNQLKQALTDVDNRHYNNNGSILVTLLFRDNVDIEQTIRTLAMADKKDEPKDDNRDRMG